MKASNDKIKDSLETVNKELTYQESTDVATVLWCAVGLELNKTVQWTSLRYLQTRQTQTFQDAYSSTSLKNGLVITVSRIDIVGRIKH